MRYSALVPVIPQRGHSFRVECRHPFPNSLFIDSDRLCGFWRIATKRYLP
jgi:hypothetical protein